MKPLWQVHLGEPLVTQEKDVAPPGADCGISANAAWQEWETFAKDLPTGLDGLPKGVNGLVGIEATPVIDLANNQVLVGFKTVDISA